MGFVRRFSYVPGVDVITQIEGVIIVSLPPPAAIQGVDTGVSCCVGEFADMTLAIAVDGSGNFTSDPQPTEVFSGQDLINKFGGFDETIGEFGGSFGNGFCDLRNKQFSRLIVVPVNLASPLGGRLVRQLPTNAAATSPTPVVPMAAISVPAGTEFKASGNRVRTAAAQSFTDDDAYATGDDGVTTGTDATFSSATASFILAGVAVGDAIVVGVLGASGAQGSLAKTYRVAQVNTLHELTLENLDGSALATLAVGTALAYRLHPAAAADTGVGLAAAAAQYLVPARPLDATIAASVIALPTVATPTPTASSWDPLSGLEFIATPTSGGIVYTAATQAPNAASAPAIDALYQAAISSLLSEESPASDVTLVWASRKSATIANALVTHVVTNSAQGTGRTCQVSPPLTVIDPTVATNGSNAGTNRNERSFYSWPGGQTSVPEAVGFSLKGADGKFYTTGIIDVPMDGWLNAVCSNLPPENNPGQEAAPATTVLLPVLGYQRGIPKGTMNMAVYKLLRRSGVCGLRMDKQNGAVFQSGVTSSINPGEQDINRQRFADFVDDSIADAISSFSKLPLTPAVKDSAETEIDSFLGQLLSEENPSASRIAGYLIDITSGNTPDLAEQNVYVIIYKVQMNPTADFIVLQSTIGPGVDVSQ